MTSRWLASIASIGLVAAVVSPVVRDPIDDGFPLSTYPMFAAPRPTSVTMRYALGVTRDGGRRTLAPRHLGTGEVMQAVASLQRGAPATLCTAIAARVAADDDYADVVAIRLVSGEHDAVAYLADGAIGDEATLARCELGR